MKLKKLGNNETEVEIGKYTILFSYNTPVAYNEEGVGFFRTKKKWSSTTSKHINQWLGGAKAKEVEQGEIEALLK